MQLTEEQQKIVEAEGNLIVNAYAGSGKTSTLLAYAAKRPRKDQLYLAFNASVKDEAKKTFKEHENVDVKTAHGLAFQALQVYINYKIQPYDYTAFALCLHFYVNPTPEYLLIMSHAYRLFKTYCQIEDRVLKEVDYTSFLHTTASIEVAEDKSEDIIKYAQEIWNDMENKKMEIIHDFYLKLYQLSDPVLDYDIIYFDECQDASGVMLDVFKRQEGQKIMVGDEYQCLVEGTLVTMGDGTQLPIEQVKKTDLIKSCHGYSKFKPTQVLQTYKKKIKDKMVRIILNSGKTIESTLEHTHFANYSKEDSPNKHILYLMYKKGVGFRLGTSGVRTSRANNFPGFGRRCVQEFADGVWILKTYDDVQACHVDEMLYSVKYGIPTMMFFSRAGKKNHAIFTQPMIDELFERADTWAKGALLLKDHFLFFDKPHYFPKGSSKKKSFSIRLLAHIKAKHSYNFSCTDKNIKKQLENAGFSLRKGKKEGYWRIESASKDYGSILDKFNKIKNAINIDINFYESAKLKKGYSLFNFIPASHVREGMVMCNSKGVVEVVKSVELFDYTGYVYDLDINITHNFIANGIVTHNSIYSFRNAVNALNKVDYPRYFLSNSFRFGPEIAAVANNILAERSQFANLLDLPTDMPPLVGMGPIAITPEVDYNSFVCRTNSALFAKTVELVSKHPGIKLYLEGGMKGYALFAPYSQIYDIIALYTGAKHNIKSAMMKAFSSFKVFEDYAKSSEEQELLNLIALVKTYRTELYNLIPKVKKNIVKKKKECDALLSTVHKAKGMEYKLTYLPNDFIDVENARERLDNAVGPDERKHTLYNILEEYNILYVAVTRGIDTVKSQEDFIAEQYGVKA